MWWRWSTFGRRCCWFRGVLILQKHWFYPIDKNGISRITAPNRDVFVGVLYPFKWTLVSWCKRFSYGIISCENVLTVSEMLWYECACLLQSRRGIFQTRHFVAELLDQWGWWLWSCVEGVIEIFSRKWERCADKFSRRISNIFFDSIPPCEENQRQFIHPVCWVSSSGQRGFYRSVEPLNKAVSLWMVSSRLYMFDAE